MTMTRMKTLAAAAALAFGAAGTFAQTGGDDPQHSGGRGYVTNGSQSPNARGSNRPGDVAVQHAPADERGWNGNHGRAYDNSNYRGHDYNNGNYHGRDYRGDSRYVQRDWSGHRWQRGERLPPEWNSRYYVVDDWRGHHLHRPPSGYHWVQSGSDYLLVAIATGVIASVLLNQ